MVNLDNKLTNIRQILSELEESFRSSETVIEVSFLEEQLRKLNFEANDFFENLTFDFDISNTLLKQIIKTVTNLLNIDIVRKKELFDFKINLLNLQIFIPIHLLFLLSSNNLAIQIEKQKHLEKLVDFIYDFEETPIFEKVQTLEEKHILDNYFRIYGSLGDLFYLLSSNLTVVKQDYLIKWSNNCFKQFFLLDKAIEAFDPLSFYISNNLPVEDLYREIVGHYTILGNTNPTNLLEFILSIEDSDLLSKIDFKPYIEFGSIESLENKIQQKTDRISSLLKRVSESKESKTYFISDEDPLSIISFKLMATLEKYFQFTKAKISSFKKEFNQLTTPASTELNNTLELCENWLQTTISLTEENENILDTPFGGLFNSVFLEYLLLLSLDDGKKIAENKTKTPLLEETLEKYKNIYINENHTFEQIADFIYFKTYCQLYVYCLAGSRKQVQELIEEFYSILDILEKLPFLKLNSLFLLIVLEIVINERSFNSLSDLTEQVTNMITKNFGLEHIYHDVTYYLEIIKNFSEEKSFSYDSLKTRLKPKILDINSWLIPDVTKFLETKNLKSFKIVSFNQISDRIVK